jgi:hypothetical protein
MRSLVAVALMISLAGCAISKAAQTTVSKDLAADCNKHCASLDMRLTAVVIVANQGGCVCEPTSSPASNTSRAGATAGGGAFAAIEQMKRDQHTTGSIPSIPSTPSIR